MHKDTDQHVFYMVKYYDNAFIQCSKYNHFYRTAF